MIDEELHLLAGKTLVACRSRGWRIGTAESCTGGLIAAALTEIAGSSDVVEGGFVTYSNAVKSSSLAVPLDLIARVGAVSSEVAAAMAEGALASLEQTTLTIAVTGIAGPSGGTPEKPVGLVHFALAHRDRPTCNWHQIFPGDRVAIRRATAVMALKMIAERALS